LGNEAGPDPGAQALLPEYPELAPKAEAAPEEAPPRLRVWVIMGGGGVGRDASLESGLHVFRQLHSQADLQVRGRPRLARTWPGRTAWALQSAVPACSHLRWPAPGGGSHLCLRVSLINLLIK